MTHILFDRDTSSGHYVIPVRCERANWRNCPQHKHLKTRADKTPNHTPTFDNDSASHTVSYAAYTNAASNSATTVGGFTYETLYGHGLTGEDIRELSTTPPVGSVQSEHTWTNTLLNDSKNIDSFVPSFVIAEALVEETGKANKARYDNLSEDNSVRVQQLQEGGSDYYKLASIVLDDKEGVFNTRAKEAAEKVQLRSNRLGSRDIIGTPLTKNPNTDLWEVDPVVTELSLHVKNSISNMDESKQTQRGQYVNEYTSKSSQKQQWDSKGLASTGRVYEGAGKPSEQLVHYRLKNRIFEKELAEFDAQKPAGLFGRRKRQQERELIVTTMADNKKLLDAAEHR